MRPVPRHWLKYQYYDPSRVLPRIHQTRMAVAESDLSTRVKSLRKNKLRGERENWDAAVFAFLLSHACGVKVLLSREEAQDYDNIFCWKDGEDNCFAPVQMKELVPAELNPTASLEQIFKGIRKYVDSSDLIVAIKLNRLTTIDFDSLKPPTLPIKGIWLFGATHPRELQWSLFGYVQETWKRWDATLPEA